jgi:hypothetical protein
MSRVFKPDSVSYGCVLILSVSFGLSLILFEH